MFKVDASPPLASLDMVKPVNRVCVFSRNKKINSRNCDIIDDV